MTVFEIGGRILVVDAGLAFPRDEHLGVDLVLQGHDHSYSRSYLIEDGVKQNPAEQPGATRVFQDPGGVIYVTGNSSSGRATRSGSRCHASLARSMK